MSRRASDGLLEIEYGYYPQDTVSKAMQKELEEALRFGRVQETGNTYTTDFRKYNDYNHGFVSQIHREYEYQGKRYVRVKANSCYDGGEFTLSNGGKYKDGDYVWVEVSPVEWIVDEQENIAISERIIFAGVQFNDVRNYRTNNWNQTVIKQFMDQYLSKDLRQGFVLLQNLKQETIESDTTSVRKKNPYNFSFQSVTEEEIIRGAIESNVSVFLHGRSSEGKSARVKQIDPDCEIIYLRNATPDSLNGKSVYNGGTGEMIDIPPTWFQKVVEKCKQEPDKIHIIFFDELTNSLPSIQGMAFNIVLDGEVNGKWKLPDNARIVAAGNDINDSMAANTMAEPLFNRFAHVYINTTVESWLKWASTPQEEYQRLDYKQQEKGMKIHPAIYAYIAWKGERVLRTPYNGEKPNADPRKWEMASKILYTTGKPEMLRGLVGEEITKDFIEFCRQQVFTVEDIVNGNYSSRDLEMNTSMKYATAVGLSSVDEENLEVVRDFILKLGREILATFENLWIHGDSSRLEKIAELRAMELTEGGIRR